MDHNLILTHWLISQSLKEIIEMALSSYQNPANPVEVFIKPLGKAMKITNFQQQKNETALNKLLAS